MPKTSSPRTYAGRTAVAPSARVVLRGDLDKIGLSTVLTMLEMERRTGLLVARKGRQAVRMEVRDGQVIRARVAQTGVIRAADPTGADAVYLALGWSGGTFQFYGTRVIGRDEVGLRTAFLLMEGIRRIDEARGIIASPTVPADAFAIS